LNLRKLSTELSHHDIAQLESAKHHAGVLGLGLNTHITFAPYRAGADVPTPADVAATFEGLRQCLGMWVPRNTGRRFTYLRVVHTDEDGSNPHLHVFMHLPRAGHRDELQAMLLRKYGNDPAGGLVAMVTIGTDQRVRHKSGYYGSTFDYITRFKSQKAFRKQGGSTWRASRRDENGRHRAIKCRFIGRLWATSHNINAKAREAYDETQRRSITSARVEAERQERPPPVSARTQ
jgi:hypothetical protein